MIHGTEGPVTAAGLAQWLRGFVVDQIEELVAEHAPGWRLPATFGGHRVEPDVAADLVYTLGHLHAGGVDQLAGTPVADDFYAMMDGYMAKLDAMGCTIALTADHGMNAKFGGDGQRPDGHVEA